MSAQGTFDRIAVAALAVFCGIVGAFAIRYFLPESGVQPWMSTWGPTGVAVACGLVAALFGPKIVAVQLVRNVILGLAVVLVPLMVVMAALPFFV
jgi:hypothetical protein